MMHDVGSRFYSIFFEILIISKFIKLFLAKSFLNSLRSVFSFNGLICFVHHPASFWYFKIVSNNIPETREGPIVYIPMPNLTAQSHQLKTLK